MTLYSLKANGRTLVEVEMDDIDWLPVKPRLHPRWLRTLVASALRGCFGS